MTLDVNINTREFKKFDEWDTGETCVRTKTQGTIKNVGLNIAGLITIVQLNSSTWTALPTTALTDRNAISIQNQSDIEIKINYSSLVSGYEGIIISAGGERFYDITEDIIIYAKSESGTPYIAIEEIS